MKQLLSALILVCLCATAGAQTIKSLGYNTTNGHVVYNASNSAGNSQLTLRFTNSSGIAAPVVNVGNIITTSNAITFYGTNSGFQFSAGASAAQLRNSLGLGISNNVRFNYLQIGPDVVIEDSGELKWGEQSRFSLETMEFFAPFTFDNTTNAAATRTNLGLYATNVAAVKYAAGLFDEANAEPSLRVEDGYIAFSAATINSNAPTDTTNAVRWIDVNVLGDTNTYKLPLYQ